MHASYNSVFMCKAWVLDSLRRIARELLPYRWPGRYVGEDVLESFQISLELVQREILMLEIDSVHLEVDHCVPGIRALN